MPATSTSRASASGEKIVKVPGGKKSPVIKYAIWLIVIVVILVIVPASFWRRPQANQPTIYVTYYPDRFCDENGGRKTLDHRTLATAKFQETIPTGCWSLMKTPEKWRGNWHGFPVNAKNCALLYFVMVPPSHHPIGPFNWCNDADPHVPPVFWVQAIQPREEIEFSTDDPNIQDVSEVSPLSAPVGLVTEPTLVNNPPVQCTVTARAANLSDPVTISITVTEEGGVRDVTLEKSTGIPSLDEEIIRTAGNYKFNPAMQGGHPVPFRIARLSVDFEKPCQ